MGASVFLEERKSGKRSVISDDFNTNTIGDNLTFLLESVVIGLKERGESEFSRDEDLLTTWELELSSSQGLLSVWNVLRLASNGQKDLTNGDSCTLAKSLTEGTSHTLLESICTSAGKHLVDSNDVPWMDSDSHVEVLSTAVGLHVFVASNSGGLKSFGGDLLLLVANQMDALGESFILGLLFTDIVDSKFWVWYTSVESGLWIWLVLLVPVAPGWSSSHYYN